MVCKEFRSLCSIPPNARRVVQESNKIYHRAYDDTIRSLVDLEDFDPILAKQGSHSNDEVTETDLLAKKDRLINEDYLGSGFITYEDYVRMVLHYNPAKQNQCFVDSGLLKFCRGVLKSSKEYLAGHRRDDKFLTIEGQLAAIQDWVTGKFSASSGYSATLGNIQPSSIFFRSNPFTVKVRPSSLLIQGVPQLTLAQNCPWANRKVVYAAVQISQRKRSSDPHVSLFSTGEHAIKFGRPISYPRSEYWVSLRVLRAILRDDRVGLDVEGRLCEWVLRRWIADDALPEVNIRSVNKVRVYGA